MIEMTMQRWDPFAELRRFNTLTDRLWSGFTQAPANQTDGAESWAIPLDVYEDGDNVVVHASLPGVRPDDINVGIEDNVLTIRAQTSHEHEAQSAEYLMRERRVGSFYRALRLPDTVDQDRVNSVYENGVLTINLPKSEAKKARRIEVKAQ